MFKRFTTRRPIAPGAVLVATALVLAGCSGDDDTPDAASDVSVELPADAQAALDEAQEAVEQADEATEQAREDAEDALDDVLASVPELPQGEPSDTDEADDADEADADGDADVSASLPSADQIEELGECFGFDFGELADFEGLEEALEQFEDLDLGTVPGGSVPFDMTIFEDLAEMGELTPEEIQRLVEEQLEQLQGAMSSVPDMSIPPMSMPDFSVPSLPFDPAELEDCLNDAADG